MRLGLLVSLVLFPASLAAAPVPKEGPPRIVVVASHKEIPWGIYVVHADTGESKRLTNTKSVSYGPTCSPDGKQIAFAGGSRYSEIWLMKLDGTDQEQLTKVEGDCSLYRWSPDGKRIAFVLEKDMKRRICVVEVATGKHVELADVSCTQLAWSPDGKRLLYVPGDKEPFHVMNPDGSDDQKIPGTEGGKEAAWAPDGKRIAFSMFVFEPHLGWQLFTIGPDGKNRKQLSTQANFDGYVHPSWSPDGTRIAYGVQVESVNQIGVVSATGGETRVITTGEHPHTYARWSPDGKSLAYLRTKKAERPELFVSDPDGRESKALLPNVGYAVEWRPK